MGDRWLKFVSCTLPDAEATDNHVRSKGVLCSSNVETLMDNRSLFKKIFRRVDDAFCRLSDNPSVAEFEI